jgi:hypothetical protein
MDELFTISGTRDYKLLSAKIPTNVDIFRNLALRLTDILKPVYRFDSSSNKPLIMSNKNGNQIFIAIPMGPYDTYRPNGITPAYTNGFVSFNIYATNTNGRLASDEELIEIATDVANAINKVIAEPSYLPPPLPLRKIPAGSDDAVTREDIKDKDEMVDFDNEFSFNRFYHKTTLLSLYEKNPFTRQRINPGSIKYYTAQIETGGKRKRKTKKRKQVHRNTRRRVVHKTLKRK